MDQPCFYRIRVEIWLVHFFQEKECGGETLTRVGLCMSGMNQFDVYVRAVRSGDCKCEWLDQVSAIFLARSTDRSGRACGC
jgi:hypothetical protein